MKIQNMKKVKKKLRARFKSFGRVLFFFKQKHRKFFSPLEVYLRRKEDCNLSFDVVTAVYNTAPYLEDYFKSLTRQSLNFKKHIRLILVDDGSTDNSAEIIKKWQKKYPANITYIHQKNKGASAARNTGMGYLTSDWVAFIDSDDFVHPHYFYNVANAVLSHPEFDIKFISCNQIQYVEAKHAFVDNRPFRHFHKDRYSIYPVHNWGDAMELSASSVFWKVEELKKQGIVFPKHLTLTEDFYFLMDYAANCTSGVGVFCKKPYYYYRQRKTFDSQSDQFAFSRDAYLSTLENGNLVLLKSYYNKFGQIPKHLQRLIFYTMVWRIRWVLNDQNKLAILSLDEKRKFIRLCDEIFSYIEEDVILGFPWGVNRLSRRERIGILYCFKGVIHNPMVIYVSDYDFERQIVKVSYFTQPTNFEYEIKINDTSVVPAYSKNVNKKFIDRTFINEKILWIPLRKGQILTATYKNESVKLMLKDKEYFALGHSRIFQTFATEAIKKPHWIFLDRELNADDNAEHLYRYVALNYPDREIYFALKKNCAAWKRLEKDGFCLVDFDSKEYIRKLETASKVISSQLGVFILRGQKKIKLHQFIFLQHGVTIHDISRGVNGKRMNLMTVSTLPEYKSIVSDKSPYSIGKREVQLTGFARHDQLLKRYEEAPLLSQKIILIMPTWRSYLATPLPNSTQYVLCHDFGQSSYAQAWAGLICSPFLQGILQKYGYRVQFFPHHCMQDWIDTLAVPSYVEVVQQNSIMDFQKYLIEASILITDYSSVAFDVAFLEKPVVYYHFDEGSNSSNFQYEKGYFDFARDGFGPIATTESRLIEYLEKIMKDGGKVDDLYSRRMKETFPRRDGNNCRRIYEQILALDEVQPQRFIE